MTENQITPKTKAVIGVHLFGQPFDVQGIKQVCESHNLTLIEDAAQAQGAMWNNEKAGAIGHMGCFSFYATKNMTTGEGGMVTTSDKALNERLRLLINHGQSEKYLHTRIGYNYRLTDVDAAIGLVQLKKLEKFNTRRRKNAEYFDAHISVKGIVTPFVAPGMHHVYHQYVVRLTEEFPMSRAEFMEYLKQKVSDLPFTIPSPSITGPCSGQMNRIPAPYQPVLPLQC